MYTSSEPVIYDGYPVQEWLYSESGRYIRATNTSYTIPYYPLPEPVKLQIELTTSEYETISEIAGDTDVNEYISIMIEEIISRKS